MNFFFWGNKNDVTSDRRVIPDEVEMAFNQVLKVGSETGTLQSALLIKSQVKKIPEGP